MNIIKLENLIAKQFESHVQQYVQCIFIIEKKEIYIYIYTYV